MAAETALRSVRTSLQNISENLERFLSYDEKHSIEILSAIQDVFGVNKKDEALCNREIEGCPFPSLQLDSENVDNEVIWQQLELQNESLLQKIRAELTPLLNNENPTRLIDVKLSTSEGNGVLKGDGFEDRVGVAEASSTSELECLVEKNIDDSDNDEEDDEKRGNKAVKNRLKPKSTGKTRGSIVDDKFFKLAEMERFLEGKHGRDDVSGDESDEDENIDYFMNLNEDSPSINKSTDHDAQDLMYSDYFDDPDGEGKEMEDGEEDDVDDIESDEDGIDFGHEEITSNNLNVPDDAPKSTLEKQQDKVKKQIAALEESNIAAKSWQLTGETSATARPANSLLEEVLQFDHTSAPAPVITEETSKQLEDIILQRIKDNAWDDVERKEKPVKEPYEYKKAQPINQEKSKMSLSEIYEKEYLQQQNPVVEKENAEHEEIKKLMKSLFLKLDALTNFHFTPKPLKSEVTIVANVPSISIEECTPVNVSETALLAPEEVYEKQKVEIKSRGEMTKEDRNRERRAKKRRQRLAAKEKAKVRKVVEKTKPRLGNKYSKARAMQSLEKDKSSTIVDEKSRDTSLTSSSSFFNQLQESVRDEIQHKRQAGKNERKNKTSSAHCRL